MSEQNDIVVFIDEHRDTFTAISDQLWNNPEMSWREHDAVESQIAIAEQAGMRITRNVGGLPTAFYAEAGMGGPVVAILGEYDALAGLSQASGVAAPQPDPNNSNGNGHGCGHHLFGSGSLLAALAAAEHLASRKLPGRVRYYGCPAEESGGGKGFMVKAGAFDDVDAAVTWHPAASTGVLQLGSVACLQTKFHFTGIAAHAGNSPHLGRSALDAVELMNVGANFLREHMPLDCRIHYAITDAGGASPNVVQAKSTVLYLVRATTTTEAQGLLTRVIDVARGAALMTGTQVEIEFEGGMAELLPNVMMENVMDSVWERLGPVPFDDADRVAAQAFRDTLNDAEVAAARAENGIPLSQKSPLHEAVKRISDGPRGIMGGSTDVGDVSWAVPTVQSVVACVAIGTPAHTWQLVAQGKLPAAHKGLIHAAKVMALSAATLLTDEAVLFEAKAEFAERLAQQPYVCPIPDGVVAPPLRG